VFALLRKRRVHRLLVLEPEPVLLKRDDFADKTAPLEELDSYVEDLLAEQKTRDQQERSEFLNDPRRQLEERLEKGDPVRKSRGRLVGIVCLSDILRYVIGSASEETDKTRSRGASVASSTSLGSQEPSHQEAAHRDATQTIPEHEPLQL
jgi:CBS domain-containing protein